MSSGSPPAAIAVVRISGPGADAALEALAGPLPPPRRASLRSIRWKGELLDQGLVLRFPGPGSATGEDLAELHLHGGRSVTAAVLAALSEVEGLRAAEPGEFTRRALENGRIDLTEAEGLADLLSAETETQRRAALALAGGALRRHVEFWQQRLLRLAALVEAALDFSDEDDVGEALPGSFPSELGTLIDDVARFLSSTGSVERLKDGVRVVIAGPANAGKSSLLNALVGREAAITSDIEGTTRDLVEAPVAIDGIAFLLIDTAGLRDARDRIEAIGVERAREAVAAADLVLWLGEAAHAPQGAIAVHSKADLGPPGPRADIAVSAVTGEGLDRLLALLAERARELLPREGEVSINRRHHIALAGCAACLEEALASPDLLIKAEALRQARLELDRITGRAGVEDMLDALFAGFCIGK